MDNDDAIVGRIWTRRETFALAAKAGMGLLLPASAAAAELAYQAKARKEVKLIASPALTEGPFFVDEHLNRRNLLEGTDREAVIKGTPLLLDLTLYALKDGKFAPLPGATVDIWHCDAHGVYSDENHPMNPEKTAGQKWLRGFQKSDKEGKLQFLTIVPGFYQGRTTHIHFKVRQPSGSKTKEFTSQLFFNDEWADRIFKEAPYRVRGERETRNSSDGIFMEKQVDGSVAGDHLTLDVKSAAKGYAAKFAIALTDQNFSTERRGFGGPGGPPPGGFGGPPPGF